MAPKRAAEPKTRGKKRPEGISDAAWADELKRLSYVNEDRRSRAKKARILKEQNLRDIQAAAFVADQQTALRHRQPSQPALSPSSPAYYNDRASASTSTPSDGIDLNITPSGSTACRGPLAFQPTPARSGLSAEHVGGMSQAYMSQGDAALQELFFESQRGGNLADMSQEWAAEDYGGENFGETMEEGEEEEVDATTVEAEAVAAKKRQGGKGKKWAALEDECLAEAWKAVSIDPLVGANQNSDKYWHRIKVAFNERSLVDDCFNKMKMDRNESAISHRWATLQHACNKFHGNTEEINSRPASGKSAADLLLDAMEAYRVDNKDVGFRYMHVFTKIMDCDKWTELRKTLGKGGAACDPAAAAPAASEGRPIGNKAAKAARNAAPAMEKLHASIEKSMADAAAAAERQRAEFAEKWDTMMAKQDAKITLSKTRVVIEKRAKDIAFLMMDRTTMTPVVKGYFNAQCAKILQEMAAEEEHVEEQAPRASWTHTVDEGVEVEVEVTSPSTMPADADVFS